MNTTTAGPRKVRPAKWTASLAALACALAWAGVARAQSEVPAGTRFLVELRDKLEARKVKVGKKFEARTMEPIQATDGNSIPSWTKLKGQVTYVRDNQMVLRFERIEPPGGKMPIVATVTGVIGEKDIKGKAGEEGEIKAASHRGRDAAIGAAVLGGIGAAVGATQGGGRGAVIGATAGGATGAVIGAAAGGPKDLVLHQGTRLEVQLDRPLVFRARR
ncbi:MAG: hypothetical protein HY237_07890 [Acidobacteria bacterium]|nr:hypothetical protein [Acidobacteriota bacterium]